VGSAPTRNRLRRRLQALMLEHSRAGSLPGGSYLITATPAATQLSYAELSSLLGRALASLPAAT
jgi:ribonuclease P protein component